MRCFELIRRIQTSPIAVHIVDQGFTLVAPNRVRSNADFARSSEAMVICGCIDVDGCQYVCRLAKPMFTTDALAEYERWTITGLSLVQQGPPEAEDQLGTNRWLCWSGRPALPRGRR